MGTKPPSAPEGWKHVDTVYDERHVYENADGVELIQRPGGEWTQRPPGCPIRLELGTHDLEEAARRVTWTSEEWASWKARRRVADDPEFRGAIAGVPLISEAEARRWAEDPEGVEAEINASLREWIEELKREP